MYHGYWRDKVNAWMLVGVYSNVAEVERGLERHHQQSKPRGSFDWVNAELVTQDATQRVVAVYANAPLSDAELLVRYPVTDPPPPERQFITSLNARQRSELAFAEVYVTEFNHNTDGHDRLLLIARLAELLDEHEALGAVTGRVR